jgi:tetratricopeptide (TPR) repeat protein
MSHEALQGLLSFVEAARLIEPRQKMAAAEGLYATAYWLLEEDRVRDAADVSRTLVLLAPEDERGWLLIGTCHERIGQDSVAAELYAAGCAFIRDSVKCRVALARALRSLARDDEAITVLEDAVDLASGNEELKQLALSEGRNS